MSESSLPPVRRTITVPWDRAAAFRRFTAGIADWWPVRTHSIGGELVQRVVFEERVGGRIYEEHIDGRRFQWGVIRVWDPPSSVVFTWHPSQQPEKAQEVEIRFTTVAGGTRLDLTHSGWERLGELARRTRQGYHLGWRQVLEVWAARRSPFLAAMNLLTRAVRFLDRLRSKARDPRDQAGGEIEPSGAGRNVTVGLTTAAAPGE